MACCVSALQQLMPTLSSLAVVTTASEDKVGIIKNVGIKTTRFSVFFLGTIRCNYLSMPIWTLIGLILMWHSKDICLGNVMLFTSWVAEIRLGAYNFLLPPEEYVFENVTFVKHMASNSMWQHIRSCRKMSAKHVVIVNGINMLEH